MKRFLALVVSVLISWIALAPAAAQSTGGASLSTVENDLRPGDLVRISVWPESTLGGEFTVEESGNVYLPILGEVNTTGVPMDELRTELREQYRQYYQDAVVTVTPAFTVGVLGEVQRPGLYVITPTETLFDVIGMAGGFRTTANEERVRVVREGEVVRINALRTLQSGSGLDPLVLRSGDQIIVDSSGLGWNRARDVLALFQTVALVITLVDRLR
jgi:protein involved in polysaccharide export with SLBB domain